MQAKTEEGFSEAKSIVWDSVLEPQKLWKLMRIELQSSIPHQQIPAASSTCTEGNKWNQNRCFCVLLTMHLTIILDNDQLDTHLLYFTIRLLQSSTCFKHYMLIIRRLNCIDAASGIVLSVSDLPVHSLRENQFSLNLCTGRPLTE